MSQKGDNLWSQAEECDKLLNDCDAIIAQQVLLYKGLSLHTEELQAELDKTRAQLHSAENPPKHKDPVWTGTAGVLIGIFLVLSLQK